MRKVLLGLVTLGGLAFANVPGNGQTFQNGPYYANPSWDQQIPAAQRFIVLSNWNNYAVLDRETGLVWQRSPSVSQFNTWSGAVTGCHVLGGDTPATPTGNRLGWRLPSVEELASLVDRTQSNPALPPGNPFQNIYTNGLYWTSTTDETTAAGAYAVLFGSSGGIADVAKFGGNNYWCVRGGSSVSNPPY